MLYSVESSFTNFNSPDSTAREKNHTDDDESDGDDGLPSDEDEDEMLRMTDTLTKIMV
jgi:hypothetical protein